MSNITISVIIPVYNVEKYLPKCLDSVCAQADCVREIILINDGSTDGSLAICKSYAQKDERIKIIEQENKGLSATVRVGVRVATCDYVGFVDSDDYIEPDMYKILSEELVNAQAQIAWCEYNRVNEAGKNLDIELTESGKVEAFEKRDGKFPIPVYPLPFVSGLSISGSRCNKLIKKDLLINNISFEDFGISFGEDLALIAPVMFTADKIVYVRQYLYHYLQRDTSIVHVYKRSCFDDYIKIIDIIDPIKIADEPREIIKIVGECVREIVDDYNKEEVLTTISKVIYAKRYSLSSDANMKELSKFTNYTLNEVESSIRLVKRIENKLDFHFHI